MTHAMLHADPDCCCRYATPSPLHDRVLRCSRHAGCSKRKTAAVRTRNKHRPVKCAQRSEAELWSCTHHTRKSRWVPHVGLTMCGWLLWKNAPALCDMTASCKLPAFANSRMIHVSSILGPSEPPLKVLPRLALSPLLLLAESSRVGSCSSHEWQVQAQQSQQQQSSSGRGGNSGSSNSYLVSLEGSAAVIYYALPANLVQHERAKAGQRMHITCNRAATQHGRTPNPSPSSAAAVTLRRLIRTLRDICTETPAEPHVT